jgi:hypothetical protein
MCFGVIRVYAIEGGVKQAKFFLISWTPQAAPLRRKVAFNAIKSQVLSYFVGVAGSIQIATHSELTEAEVTKRLDSSRGGSKPAAYEFGTGSEGGEEDYEVAARLAREAAEAAEAARLAEIARLEAERVAAEEAAVAAAAQAAADEEARIAAEAAAREAERQAKISSLPKFARTNIKRLVTEPVIMGYDFSALLDAYVLEELSDVDSSTAWALVAVPEAAPKSVVVVAKGAGGPAEIHPHLGDKDIFFGALRVTAVDRKGTRVSLRSRIVYFNWNGDAIAHKTRLRNSDAIKAMKEYFKVRSGNQWIARPRSSLTRPAPLPAVAAARAQAERRQDAAERDAHHRGARGAAGRDGRVQVRHLRPRAAGGRLRGPDGPRRRRGQGRAARRRGGPHGRRISRARAPRAARRSLGQGGERRRCARAHGRLQELHPQDRRARRAHRRARR